MPVLDCASGTPLVTLRSQRHFGSDYLTRKFNINLSFAFLLMLDLSIGVFHCKIVRSVCNHPLLQFVLY